MKVQLANQEIELNFSFENLMNMEKAIGKILLYSDGLQRSDIGLSDVVSIYYHLQHGSALSQEQLAKEILKDGLVKHAGQIVQVFAALLSGQDESGDNGKK